MEVHKILGAIPRTVWNPSGFTIQGDYFSMFVKPVEVKPGNKYPIIPNLPDITGYELLKTIMVMFGLFGNYTKEGIELYSIDEFYDKKPNAKDWTSKVITGGKIDSITFTFGDFARENYLRYLKDETVLTDADSYIEVDNDTLEPEKTLYEMKFAASDSSNANIFLQMFGVNTKFIFIPIYRVKDESAVNVEYEYQKVSNRIAKIDYDQIARMPWAHFPNELFFDDLILNYYQSYQKIILHPKVIEVQVFLTDLEIYQMDLMTPVYLEQTGNYYIILELQINGNNTAKAKLLQM